MKTDEQVRRAYAVMDFIEANPDKHDQGSYVSPLSGQWDRVAVETTCGTTACFAGWTVLLDGKTVIDQIWLPGSIATVPESAAGMLGLTGDEVSILFHYDLDLAGVRKAVFEIFGPRPDGAV